VTWVIQGVAWLAQGLSHGRARTGQGWSLFFGIISLIAGIVVISAPVSSVTALTVLMGIWFIVMGALEMYGSLVFRHAEARETRQGAGRVSGRGPRAGAGAQRAQAARAGAGPGGDPAGQDTGGQHTSRQDMGGRHRSTSRNFRG